MVNKRDEYEDEEHLDLGGPYLEQVYPCGCKARVCQCGCDNEPDIVDCSLHGAAEDLYSLLTCLTATVEQANSLQHSRKSHTIPPEDWNNLYHLTQKARVVLSRIKVKGEEAENDQQE